MFYGNALPKKDTNKKDSHFIALLIERRLVVEGIYHDSHKCWKNTLQYMEQRIRLNHSVPVQVLQFLKIAIS